MGMMFAGTPALALARRWDAVAAGETLPRARGPVPTETARPAPKPATVAPPEPAIAPAIGPTPAFLRLGRVHEYVDAERRARRHAGFVRAGY